jgi:hypothetical protein
MSPDVIYNCVTCSKAINGKQHYAVCVSCSRRVHRKCYGDGLSNSIWTRIRKTFTCTACEESIGKTLGVSTYVPPTTIEYEIMIAASQKGGDIVKDNRGYTYRSDRDFPSFRVWRCTFRGCGEFTCCNTALRQITRPGIDFLRHYSQGDFTLDAEREHSHPPNDGVTKRQFTVGQSCSATNGPSLNLENISTAESARVSADVGVSIDYQDTHNTEVTNAKRKRCPDQQRANKKQCIAFSPDELFGDKR